MIGRRHRADRLVYQAHTVHHSNAHYPSVSKPSQKLLLSADLAAASALLPLEIVSFLHLLSAPVCSFLLFLLFLIFLLVLCRHAFPGRYFDISKARRDLGYRPVVAFEDGWPSAVAVRSRQVSLAAPCGQARALKIDGCNAHRKPCVFSLGHLSTEVLSLRKVLTYNRKHLKCPIRILIPNEFALYYY